jgi:hypothetical protein
MRWMCTHSSSVEFLESNSHLPREVQILMDDYYDRHRRDLDDVLALLGNGESVNGANS